MATSKYYTPEIEEFHVGFEYEVEDLGDNGITRVWRPQIFEGEETRTYFTEELKEGEMRVKYLDKSDIQDLGWVYAEDRGMSEANGYMFRKPQKVFAKGFYKLRFWKNTNRVSIEATHGALFSGIIKNKSELKKLLKQLGI